MTYALFKAVSLYLISVITRFPMLELLPLFVRCVIAKEKFISTAKLLKSCNGVVSESHLHVYNAPEMILLFSETLQLLLYL